VVAVNWAFEAAVGPVTTDQKTYTLRTRDGPV
jgi:hypothetical protein